MMVQDGWGTCDTKQKTGVEVKNGKELDVGPIIHRIFNRHMLFMMYGSSP